jgi:hypothetical protein
VTSMPMFSSDVTYQCPKCALKSFKFSLENSDNFVKSLGGWESIEEQKKMGFIIPITKERYEEQKHLVSMYKKIVDEMNEETKTCTK